MANMWDDSVAQQKIVNHGIINIFWREGKIACAHDKKTLT